jgi:hypothetical protein
MNGLADTRNGVQNSSTGGNDKTANILHVFPNSGPSYYTME